MDTLLYHKRAPQVKYCTYRAYFIQEVCAMNSKKLAKMVREAIEQERTEEIVT